MKFSPITCLTSVAAALLVLCGTAQGQMASTSTQVRIFLPFAPGGDPVAEVEVAGSVSGTCFAQSISNTARPDAWRCTTTGDQLYDPCFQNPYGDALACAAAPFTAEVVLFSLEGELPRVELEQLQLEFRPWALVLSNGAECMVLSGTAPIVAGLRLNYACDDGFVAGEPDRSQPIWRVFYRGDEGRSSFDAVDVVSAWY